MPHLLLARKRSSCNLAPAGPNCLGCEHTLVMNPMEETVKNMEKWRNGDIPLGILQEAEQSRPLTLRHWASELARSRNINVRKNTVET